MASTSSTYEHELRDPTREELYTGPKREKLPAEIQQMAVEDTACTFCGVSYFVFAEVQELQATAKKYKKNFHEFIRFLERERKISQDLKAEILSLKKSFEQIAGTFTISAHQLAAECTQLRQTNIESGTRILNAQRELTQQQDVNQQMQSQMKRAQEEWKTASALAEQKLRNEILHLSSQIEKCKLQSSTQEAEFAIELEREKAKIKELEARYAESQELWSSSERLMVTERDQMKQKMLGMTERIEEEKNAAKQLETQLKAVQQELSRIASSNDAERTSFSQLSSEVIMLKHQLHSFEKNKALMLAERAQLQEEHVKKDALISQLGFQVDSLQKKSEDNVLATEKLKQEYVKELEKMRIEHENDLHRLQRDHTKAIDELKATQKEYIEFLKKETVEMQQGLASTQSTSQSLEKQVCYWLSAAGLLLLVWLYDDGVLCVGFVQLREVERQVSHWKDQAERSMEELKHVRQSGMQAKSMTDTMEKKILALEDQKRDLDEENGSLQRELGHQKSKAKQQMDKLQQEVAQNQHRLESQNAALQKRVDALQAKESQLKDEKNSQPAMAPQVAWGEEDLRTGGGRQQTDTSRGKKNGSRPSGNNNNQESHNLEKVIEKLRLTLDQKEREIALLQQTVHRECLERTSLLEKMRSGKILPDMVGVTSVSSSSLIGDTPWRGSGNVGGVERETRSNPDENESSQEPAEQSGASQPKASFYEKLRKAGQRKSKPRK